MKKKENKKETGCTLYALNVTFSAQNWTSSPTRQAVNGKNKQKFAKIHFADLWSSNISIKNRKFLDFFFLHIRLDLVELRTQMVLLSKFRADTAENGPVKVEKVQFSKNHFSPLATNFSILSSFNVRTRRDLAPGTENFRKIDEKMTKKNQPKSGKLLQIDACPGPLSERSICGSALASTSALNRQLPSFIIHQKTTKTSIVWRSSA